MSSTNRGYDRHKSDYYVTPQKPIEEFLKVFVADEDLSNLEQKLWLDPCAGGDDKNEMSYPAVIKRMYDDPVIETVDERKDSLADNKEDYRMFTPDQEPEIIITNPPFYSAQEIITKALQDVADNGYVIMLLRLNFWGSKTREMFLKNNTPKYCYIHPRRMSFTDDGKTDSIEYAHFIWHKTNKNNKFCLTKLI